MIVNSSYDRKNICMTKKLYSVYNKKIFVKFFNFYSKMFDRKILKRVVKLEKKFDSLPTTPVTLFWKKYSKQDFTREVDPMSTLSVFEKTSNILAKMKRESVQRVCKYISPEMSVKEMQNMVQRIWKIDNS